MKTCTPAKIDCHGVTDCGQQRDANEDQFMIADLVKALRIDLTSLSHDRHTDVTGHSHGKVFAVADGVGGHVGGERASMLAVDETISFMVDRMRWSALLDEDSPEDAQRELAADLKKGFLACQRRIFAEAALNPKKQGMGTTLTMALLDWPTAHLVHAGDSRCYLMRNHALRQVTRDHTLAQIALENGEVLCQDPDRRAFLDNAVWNVLGGPDSQLEPDVETVELAVGDTLLLCTDGLTKHLEDHEIAEVLRDYEDAQEACERLVGLANDRGGSDNITVVLARFHSNNHVLDTPVEESERPVDSEADTVIWVTTQDEPSAGAFVVNAPGSSPGR